MFFRLKVREQGLYSHKGLGDITLDHEVCRIETWKVLFQMSAQHYASFMSTTNYLRHI